MLRADCARLILMQATIWRRSSRSMPKLKGTLQSRGSRGGMVWLRIDGEYPASCAVGGCGWSAYDTSMRSARADRRYNGSFEWQAGLSVNDPPGNLVGSLGRMRPWNTQPVKAINEIAAVLEATNLEMPKPEFILLASANAISGRVYPPISAYLAPDSAGFQPPMDTDETELQIIIMGCH